MVMALFNKLFTSRKRYQRHQDNVCEKLFHFNNDQVRVVLFRECDFRGRKLLFDSQAVEKIPLPKPAEQSDSTVLTEEERKKRFAEVSNGHGYLYTKPNSDVRQLGEMIFGSVAMSYRGTSYKIHSLTSPSSIMCTQVFPCPRPPTCVRGTRNSAPGRTCLHDGTSQSLEHSTRLEDSTNSFTTSFSDHSVHSTASDTLLVSRRTRSSPLDMPHTNGTNGSIPNTSLVRDSGFCGGQSYSSTFSGSKSISVWESSRNDGVSFSCGSLYKRWLRSTSTSLEHSLNSLTGSNSTDDFNAKPHPRTKKLGLAVIIQFGQNQEERLEEYLLEHAVLMEAMVWRLRHSAETAYIRHTNFLSLMFDITSATRLWLTSFLSGPQLSTHMWRTLSSNCDNCFSINDDTRDTFPRGLDSVTCSLDASTASADSSRSDNCERDDFAFLNISRFFKGDCDSRANDCVNGKHKRELARKFVRELCELLETVDIKHTNFFVSTLVTAILTHHLGWVATAWTPTEADKEVFRRLEKTGNPLWGQLNDLYGAVGHPTKMAHTVITGAENSELISKTLNAMTYFIRCNNIVRQTAARGDITSENDEAHTICHERNCIPEENYKKYEDHLKEFAVNSEKCEVERKFEDSKLTLSKVESSTLKCLRKSSSCLSGLNKIYDEVKNLDAKDHNLETDVKNKDDYNKLIDYENLKYARMPRNVVSCQNLQDFYNPNVLNKNPNLNNPNLKNSNLKNPNLNNPNLNTPNLKNSNLNYPNLETDKEKEFSLCDDFNKILTPDKLRTTLRKIPRSVVSCHNLQKLNTDEEFQMNQSQLRTSLNDIIEKESNVVFVLGDDDELVGLKKDNLKMQSVKRKTSITNVNPCNEEIQFNDEDFVKLDSVYNLKPSTSYNQLNREGACSSSRAASEPPEIVKPTNETSTKPRFHYTGVKFNFKQHPQIFTNYMRSKNIEMTKFNGQLASDFDFSPYREETEVETLQTPSNASELEFVSEIQGGSNAEFRQATATVEEAPKFVRTVLPNTVIREFGRSHCSTATITEEGNLEQEENNNVGKIKTVELPMPKSIISNSVVTIGYTNSLFRGVSENYTSDMVLQGISTPKSVWEHTLRKDLILAARHPLLDQPIEEAVAIIANTDTWEVQLMSSHTYVIDKGTSGVRIGMSQLVANMLEQLLRMWKLHAPPEHCLMHIEDRLQEVCMRSKALAELLQATEFCTMDLLTSTLQLEVNDIPLLMAVASTHSPQITEKYGLSFQ